MKSKLLYENSNIFDCPFHNPSWISFVFQYEEQLQKQSDTGRT